MVLANARQCDRACRIDGDGMFRSAVQRNRYRFAIPGVAVGLLFASTAGAQSQASAADAWTFSLTPYFWAVGIDGDVGIGRLPDVDVDASFSDVWDTLDFALMGMFEARRDRYGLLFDGFYAKLSADADTPGPAFGDVDVEVTHQFYSLAGTYRVINGRAPIDLLAGIRYVHAKTEVDLGAGLLAARSGSRSKDWVDGFAGLRLRAPLTERWALIFHGDVGAGGADFTWQAIAGVGYRISDVLEAQLGYRYFRVDYDDGGGAGRFLYDIALSGPYLSLDIRF